MRRANEGAGGVGYFRKRAAMTGSFAARIGPMSAFSAALGMGFNSGEIGAQQASSTPGELEAVAGGAHASPVTRFNAMQVSLPAVSACSALPHDFADPCAYGGMVKDPV